MPQQGGFLSVRLLANVTLIGLDTSVQYHVLVQMPLLGVRLPTDPTTKGFGPGVGPPVSCQVRFLGEVLGADFTLVWFHVTVRPQMAAQNATRLKGLPAHVTMVQILPITMDEHVFHQAVLGLVGFVALVTVVRFLVRIFEGVVRRLHLDVLSQLRLQAEAFTALFTLVRLFCGVSKLNVFVQITGLCE